ncbi:MAG: hypothetical protein J6Q39_06835 [Bacteroidales bacterium]|nr:hypothetical protein [Bacteroidales bacterium]
MDYNDDYLFDDPVTSETDVDQYPPGDYTPGEGPFYEDDQDDDYSDPIQPVETPEDYLTQLLKSRGVDRDRVRIENEDGEIEEWKFDDLDDETKFGILNQSNDMLSDDEITAVNFLRQNRMNLQDFVEYQRQQAIKEYLEQNSTPQYTVDQVSDDDLFRFELQDQMPDLTDEEIEDQLNRAKENETFFQKKIAALRKEYKELEDNQIKANEEQAAAEKEEQFNQLAQSLVSVARDTEEMNGMLLDDQDKEDVLSFLLDRDANGQSEFYKLFSDPKALFKMAWTMLKGDQAHETYTQYFTNEIAKARRGTKT